jgi:hypothetical protein
MLSRKNELKRNPLTKAQNRLLKVTLKKLLGNGLIDDQKEAQRKNAETIVLRNVLRAIVLE